MFRSSCNTLGKATSKNKWNSKEICSIKSQIERCINVSLPKKQNHEIQVLIHTHMVTKLLTLYCTIGWENLNNVRVYSCMCVPVHASDNLQASDKNGFNVSSNLTHKTISFWNYSIKKKKKQKLWFFEYCTHSSAHLSMIMPTTFYVNTKEKIMAHTHKYPHTHTQSHTKYNACFKPENHRHTYSRAFVFQLFYLLVHFRQPILGDIQFRTICFTV